MSKGLDGGSLGGDVRCALFLLLGSVVLSLGGAFLFDLAVVADAVDDPGEHMTSMTSNVFAI